MFEPTLYGSDSSVPIDYKHPVNMTLFPGFLGVPTYEDILQSGMPEYAPLPVSWMNPSVIYASPIAWVSRGLAGDGNEQTNATARGYWALLRVLRFGGNNTDPNDYISWLGPVMRMGFNRKAALDSRTCPLGSAYDAIEQRFTT
ncbi:hypothetical protein DL769_005974 [Monosporascus sp. CRB-8-3]|nr:hypothetical protein DL769_005974 [Monosporascus sp. CRB-8-3]